MYSSSVFTTKAYTINSLISEISSLSLGQVTSVSTLAQAISPRAGVYGAKLAFLNNYVGGNLENVILGTSGYRTFGKTGRTRVLRALRNRQNASN